MGKRSGGKAHPVTLVIVVLILAGLGATFAPRIMGRILPGTSGVALASVRRTGQDAGAARAQFYVLLVEADDAWRVSDWSKAIEALTAILAIDPANAPMRERLYAARVNQGWRLLVEEHLPEAREQFTLALQVKPQAAEAEEGLRLLQQLVSGSPRVAGGGAVATEIPTVVVVVTATPVPCTPTPVTVCPTATPPVCVPICTPSCVPICTPACVPVCTPTCVPACTPACAQACPTTCPPTSVPICTPPCGQACPTRCPLTSVPACPQVSIPCPPEVQVRVHVVQRGDTLFRVASAFNTTVTAIMQINGLTTTTLRVGQVLVIP